MIPLSRPEVGPEEAEAVADVLRSGWLTQGARVAEFERLFAEACGAAHAVAVANGTAALQLALIAVGVGPGDEVICPSMSFIATANAIRHAGAVPVFAEVDPRTFNLDVRAAEAAITPRTRAVMPVHQLGLPADLDGFLRLGERHGLRVVEDAACALGSRYRGRPVGGPGEIACFSLHPRKILTVGEGGMITTNDAGYAARLRRLRQHGMSVNDAVRHEAREVIIERYLELGYNSRMSDIHAAVGIEQMKRLGRILARRRHLAGLLTRAIRDHPWLRPPYVPDDVEPNFQSYAVTLTDSAPLGRDELMQELLDRGIGVRRGVMLAHLEPPYADSPALPVSERASRRSLLLPLYPGMSEGELGTVVAALWDLAAR